MTKKSIPHGKKSRGKHGNKKPGKPPAGGGPNRVQTSRAERLFRLKVVEEAMVSGKRAAAVQEALAKAGRVVPARTVGDYIRAVRLKWEEEDKLHSRSTRQRQLRDLYATAEEMKANRAWASWVSCQKLIADLEGNFPKDDGPTATDAPEDFAGWSREELDAYIASGGEAEPSWIKAAREAGQAPSRGNGHDRDWPDDGDGGGGDSGGMPTPSDLLH